MSVMVGAENREKVLLTGESLLDGKIDTSGTSLCSIIWLLYIYRDLLPLRFVIDREFADSYARLELHDRSHYHPEFFAAIEYFNKFSEPLEPDQSYYTSFLFHIHQNRVSVPTFQSSNTAVLLLPESNQISALNRFLRPYLDANYTAQVRRAQELKKEIRLSQSAIFLTGPTMDELNLKASEIKRIKAPIFANSAIKNKDLLKKFSSKHIYIVSSDPIFHCGFSSYVSAFYADLMECFKNYDVSLIVPGRDYHFYRSMLPETYASRIYYLDFGRLAEFEAPLRQIPYEGEWEILNNENIQTSNVLTGFALPLAAAVSETVDIYGCDGRPDEENSYYWQHASSVQYDDRMNVIRSLHPDFFPPEYDSYYRKHLAQTRSVLFANHKRCEVRVKTPTYIPALNARYQVEPAHPAVQLSIIIPNYNSGSKVWRTINSIYFNNIAYEIVMVDDGSDQDTADILKEISRTHPNMRVIRQDNAGVSAARNAGLRASKGEYVLFIDAGDEIISPGVEIMLERAFEEQLLGIAGRVGLFFNSEKVTATRGIDGTHWNINHLPGGYPFHIAGVMLHRYIAAEVLFDEAATNAEDMEYLWNIIRRGVSFAHINRITAKYYIEPGSATTTSPAYHALHVVKFLAGQMNTFTSPSFLRVWDQEDIALLRKQLGQAVQSYLYYIRRLDAPYDLSSLTLLDGVSFPSDILGKPHLSGEQLWALRVEDGPITEQGIANFHKISEALGLSVSELEQAWQDRTAPIKSLGMSVAYTMASAPKTLKLSTRPGGFHTTDPDKYPAILFRSNSIQINFNSSVLEVDIVHGGVKERLYFEANLNKEINLLFEVRGTKVWVKLNDKHIVVDLWDWESVVIGGGYRNRTWKSPIAIEQCEFMEEAVDLAEMFLPVSVSPEA